MNITEKAAYIKGLVDGIGLDESAKETKVIKALIDIIDDMAASISVVEDDIDNVYDEIDDMQEHIDAVDCDLAELEEIVYEDEDDSEWYDDDDIFGDDDEDDYEDFEYEVECPECGETFCFDESVFDSDEPLKCPACGVEIDEIEIEDEDEDEDDLKF